MYQNIIEELNNIVSYLDLYDILGEIDDDNFRQELENYIRGEELKSTNVNQVIEAIKDKLNGYTEADDMDVIINNIKDAGNDRDLYNIIEDIEERALLSEDIIDNIRQLYKNNRYRNLDDKKSVIVEYISKMDNIRLDESLLLEYSIEDTKKDADEGDSNGDSDSDSNENSDIKNDRDRRIFQSMKDAEDEKTLLDLLQDRIGQQLSVGELNAMLQSLFGQYNKVFLMTSDLYSQDLAENQELVVENDGDMYIINYDIVDMDSGIIEITDASIE